MCVPKKTKFKVNSVMCVPKKLKIESKFSYVRTEKPQNLK